MTAHGVGPSTRPTENWQHHFSSGPQPAQSQELIQSAYRNTVENNMRRSQNRNDNTRKTGINP